MLVRLQYNELPRFSSSTSSSFLSLYFFQDSPINKQLYAKEILTYMEMVRDYYKNIKESSLVPEIEMKVFLDNIQQVKKDYEI